MKKVICIVISVMAVLVYGVALALPNNPPSAPVTVVNTETNPVPVTGNLGISGTADVNVTNTVPITGDVNVTNTVPVTGNVNVTGTVAIDNMNMKEPAVVRDECEAEGDALGCLSPMTIVPEGKRLTIEYFSCDSRELEMGGSLTCSIKRLIPSGGGYVEAIVLNLPTSPTSNDADSTIAAGQSMKLYAESGDAIQFIGYRNNSIGRDVSIFFQAAGYYEDVP